MTPVTQNTPVALLGLGIIGSRIAPYLQVAGWNVRTWNRTPKLDCPADFASPVEAATQCKVICLYLKNNEACREVLAQMLPVLTPEHIIINHSTISLEMVKELSSTCERRSVTYWDAPFTGSKLAALGGQLVYYISGPLGKLAEIRPLLEASSKGIVTMGDVCGQATIVKLVTNLIQAISVQALGEALTLLKTQGIGLPALLQALEYNVCNSALAQFKLPYMDAGDFPPHFALSNMYKDSCYVRELADQEHVNAPAIKLVSSLMGALCSQEHEKKGKEKEEEDFCSLIRTCQWPAQS